MSGSPSIFYRLPEPVCVCTLCQYTVNTLYTLEIQLQLLLFFCLPKLVKLSQFFLKFPEGIKF